MRFPIGLRALAHRDFRLFLSGQLISLIGTWMQNVAQAWLVYRLTGSPVLLGAAGFASQIPVFLLAPVGGVVADRYSRHRLVIATQTASMLLAFALAAPARTLSMALLAPALDGLDPWLGQFTAQPDLVSALRADPKRGAMETWLASPVFDVAREEEGLLDRIGDIFATLDAEPFQRRQRRGAAVDQETELVVLDDLR